MASAMDFLFDFEDANQSSCLCAGTSTFHSADLEALAHKVEVAARQTSELGRQLHQDVLNSLRRFNCNAKSSEDFYSLASALADLGYDVNLRNALGGSTSECFKFLRHEFLVIRGTGEFREMEFIVEPSLRQHFSIPHPSPEYTYVLSRTPDVFVGGSCRLVPVVQLLCALMADSFQRQGLPLPPWRREAAMLSKWLPNPSRIRDLKLRPSGSVYSVHSPAVLPSSPLLLHQQQQQPPTQNGPNTSRPNQAPNMQDLKNGDATAPMAALQAPNDGEASSSRRTSFLTASDPGVASDPALGHCPLAAVVFGFDICHGGPGPRSACQDDCGHRQSQSVSMRYSNSSSATAETLSYLSTGMEPMAEIVDDLDECASPCGLGPFAGEDTASFLFTSETSDGNSPGAMDSPMSDITSAAHNAASCPATTTNEKATATLVSVKGSAVRRKAYRPTNTGMLPCACTSAGLLSAKFLFAPMAMEAALISVALAPHPPPPPPPPPPYPSTFPSATVAKAAASNCVVIDCTDDNPKSSSFTWASSSLPAIPNIAPLPFLTWRQNLRPPTHTDALTTRGCRVSGGGAEPAAGVTSTRGACSGSSSPHKRVVREVAEWLPWGLPR